MCYGEENEETSTTNVTERGQRPRVRGMFLGPNLNGRIETD